MSTDITLSLVAHTNVGKTTLARTLLARDVGEVRDAPHVTEGADGHELLATPQGERLLLWDTPGFGDSARLARRMEAAATPWGWLLNQVWDRWRDRALWSSQQALRHVRERSDVLLYLVNAAEPQAGYLEPELRLLAWVGKPVLVLLNQTGAPRAPAEEATELQAWRERLARWPLVRAVLPLDAFARCWVQEGALLQAVAEALPPAQAGAMRRLADAWRARQQARFDAAMGLLASGLADAALRRQPLPADRGLAERLRAAVRAVGLAGDAQDAQALAQQALAAALDARVRADTEALIALHGLRGDAGAQVLQRLAVVTHQPLPEGRAALWGGLLSGAAAGLKADLATGGLTLGGGLLAGGLLGALAGLGAARAINVVRGDDRAWVGWAPDALTEMARMALLRYLAVAHYGRGRGDWVQGEAPPHWPALAREALAPQEAALQALWRARPARGETPDGAAAELARQLQPLLAGAARAALFMLYPQAAGAWPAATADNPAP